jgi:hypothetical protein
MVLLTILPFSREAYVVVLNKRELARVVNGKERRTEVWCWQGSKKIADIDQFLLKRV